MLNAYRKLIVAAVGLILLLVHRHLGLDLTGQETVIVDMIIAGLTAAGVWGLKNEAEE